MHASNVGSHPLRTSPAHCKANVWRELHIGECLNGAKVPDGMLSCCCVVCTIQEPEPVEKWYHLGEGEFANAEGCGKGAGRIQVRCHATLYACVNEYMCLRKRVHLLAKKSTCACVNERTRGDAGQRAQGRHHLKGHAHAYTCVSVCPAALVSRC
jgi:hypothetical protein